MRLILDANRFQHPELEEYLGASRENQVVFTDWACMETYQGDPVYNLSKSLEIVARYSSQVVVLKPTRHIIAEQHAKTRPTSGVSFVDHEQTAEFGKFCKHVQMAASGNSAILEQVRAHALVASQHFRGMLKDVEGYAASIQALADQMSPEHVQSLRKNTPLSSASIDEMMRLVLWLAGVLIRDHPDVERVPKPFSELRETLLFRYALANYVLASRWIAVGGANGAKPETLRNDIVDATYVAYATLFDGLLSGDKKVIGIYEEARLILESM